MLMSSFTRTLIKVFLVIMMLLLPTILSNTSVPESRAAEGGGVIGLGNVFLWVVHLIIAPFIALAVLVITLIVSRNSDKAVRFAYYALALQTLLVSIFILL